MPLRRLIFLASLVLAVAALSAATALGKANGTDRPVKGHVIFTTATGTGTLTATGSEATLVSTITGGTGRFADASGTLITRIRSVTVSVVGAQPPQPATPRSTKDGSATRAHVAFPCPALLAGALSRRLFPGAVPTHAPPGVALLGEVGRGLRSNPRRGCPCSSSIPWRP